MIFSEEFIKSLFHTNVCVRVCVCMCVCARVCVCLYVSDAVYAQGVNGMSRFWMGDPRGGTQVQRGAAP